MEVITRDPDIIEARRTVLKLTLSKHPDELVAVPEGTRLEEYTLNFKTRDENGDQVAQQATVTVGFAGDRVYIQGMCAFLPESWIEGQLVNGQLVLDLPQYMGTYDDEYQIAYPIYLNGFDLQTGLLERQVTLDYDPATRVFSNQSMPMGYGINKTGYLNVQDIYEVVLEPVQNFIIGDVNNDGRVTIADVTDLINYLLSGDATAINLAAADVDGDGRCNIGDVTELINILLTN